uniref:RAD17 checkpoint clamp loader component n=1 Tax=Gadus morhua TaxID=8049 RepID=A0A8C4Z2J7_GADMO
MRMSKRSLGRKVRSNKANCWVEPSFSNLLAGKSPESKGKVGKGPRKKKGETNSSAPRSSSLSVVQEPHQSDHNVPWVDAHAPHSQAELAVHKKKIEEVENWIRTHTDPTTSKGGIIALLTGPSGCGKSATVQVLAEELGFRLQEWTNPSNVSEYRADPEAYRQTFEPASRFNGFLSTSQTGLFQEFLLRANKYNCLQMVGEQGPKDRKLILVEDFPNNFFRQPGSLHDILRRFVKTRRCPLVFIVSENLSGDSHSRLLFPKEIQEELSICNISFNPVAPTTMSKILLRIATLEAAKTGGRLCVPDKDTLDILCSGSSGDVRSAINSLQFSSLAERGLSLPKKEKCLAVLPGKAACKRTQGKKRSKEKGPGEAEQCIGGKDVSLFLFRALGKILHFKSESPRKLSGQHKLPPHLSEHQRHSLLIHPELVVERSHMSAEFFNLYLHQNYLDFFSTVEDVARASEYLSDADFFTGEWASRAVMAEYGSSVATRGLLHCNSAQAPVGFRPLHKPNWLIINKKHRENCQAAQSLFINFCLTPTILQVELLPYLAKLSNPMRNPVDNLTTMTGKIQVETDHLLNLEALTDKDPGTLDLDDEVEGDQAGALSPPREAGAELPASQPQPTTFEALMKEEDLLIEEYDSE